MPPMQSPRRREVSLLSNEVVAPSIHILTFALAPTDPLEFAPGQYVTFFLSREGKRLTRAYSIFSPPADPHRFRLLVKKVDGGFGSTFLCSLSPAANSRLPVLAPLGKFLLSDPGERGVVFVATGTGLAPFVPMLDALRRQHPANPTWLFLGNRHVEDIVYFGELTALENQWPSFHFVPIVSRPPSDRSWTGRVGHVQEAVQEKFPNLGGADVYLCGVNEMVNEMQELALRLGCPKQRVFVERYGEEADSKLPADVPTATTASPA